MSEVDLFLAMRPEVKAFAECVGESLAENYRKGLNGSYRNRLDKGVHVATQVKPGRLVEIINVLLRDRKDKGAETVIDIPNSEPTMRALVLGLWSSRPAYIGRENRVQLKSSRVYGDEFYVPPVDLNNVDSNKRRVGKKEKFVESTDVERFVDDEKNDFDLDRINDEREKTRELINKRRGQLRFRNALNVAYSGRCAITDCDVLDVLEAAHIFPYRGKYTNRTSNGLLLRADIHTLFDIGMIAIDATCYRVVISNKLRGTAYEQLSSRTLRLPSVLSDQPSKEALDWHRKEFGL